MQAKWQNENCIDKKNLTKEMLDWLLYRDSMTVRLRSCCQDQFHIDVLCQEWQTPKPEDKNFLHLSSDEDVLAREVILSCDHKPWMYARTVIPKDTLTELGNEMIELGSRPIGELLFSDPNMKRSEFEIAQLTPDSPEFNKAIANASIHDVDKLWARRSIFNLAQKGSLAITEVFMPICWQR